MRTRMIWLLCVVFCLFICSCIDEYMPDLNKYENILVVDGMLTSEPGPHIVKLSLSSSLNQKDSNMVSGAIMFITDEDNNRIVLNEITPGIYSTEPDDWAGKYGHKYKLEITTKDKTQYESEFQEMRYPASIDSVYGQIEIESTQDIENKSRTIYQFYIDNCDINYDTTYYLWSVTETFEYDAPGSLTAIWDGYKIIYVQNRDSLKTCWKTETIPSIFTASTKDLVNNKLVSIPLNRVVEGGFKMKIRYSLLVNQFSISRNSYNYWNSLRIQNNELSSLYATHPYQVRGNIVNITNPKSIVLGNFTVASISKKRIFVLSQPDFEEVDGPICTPSSKVILRPGKIIYFGENSSGIGGAVHPACIDCRKLGGALEKPDFWK